MDVKERLTVEDAAGRGLGASEHVHRYELAAALCAGLSVADVGCGVGYGSSMLRDACPFVVGIDVDRATVETAREVYGRDGLEFKQADATRFLQSELEDIEAIVMFETLEHLETAHEALEALRGAARRGLRVIVSIPNSKTFEEENPYHRVDFGFEEATQAFESFEDVAVVYQFHAEASLIRTPDVNADDVRTTLRSPGEPEYANYFIACVNLRDRLERSRLSARVDVTLSPYHSRYMLDLERANAELYRANARLTKKKMGVSDSAAATILARIDGLKTELAETKERLRICEETRLSDEAIQSLHDQIAEQHATIVYMQATRVWRLGAAYWRIRDAVRRLVRSR